MGKRGKKISADIKEEVRLLNRQFFFTKDIAQALNNGLTTVRRLLQNEEHLKIEDYLEANRSFLKELYINGVTSTEMQQRLAAKNRNAKYNVSCVIGLLPIFARLGKTRKDPSPKSAMGLLPVRLKKKNRTEK